MSDRKTHGFGIPKWFQDKREQIRTKLELIRLHETLLDFRLAGFRFIMEREDPEEEKEDPIPSQEDAMRSLREDPKLREIFKDSGPVFPMFDPEEHVEKDPSVPPFVLLVKDSKGNTTHTQTLSPKNPRAPASVWLQGPDGTAEFRFRWVPEQERWIKVGKIPEDFDGTRWVWDPPPQAPLSPDKDPLK